MAFWARRQAHETGIHRADAESPAGRGGTTLFPPEFAVDGIEEMLFGFLLSGDGGLRADPPRTLHLQATDTDWRHGTGPEASGPMVALVMAMCGRKPALDDLAGEGVAVLRDRP